MHPCDTSRLEGEGRLLLLGPPDPSSVLAVTHSGVGVPMHNEARVDVQAHIVAIFTQVHHRALGVRGHLGLHSKALLRFEIQGTADQTTSQDRG